MVAMFQSGVWGSEETADKLRQNAGHGSMLIDYHVDLNTS
jgi:hypothetical protein